MKKKLLVFGVVGLFLMMGFVALPTMGTQMMNEETMTWETSYLSSITIEDNSDFTEKNGVINPEAMGTEGDPYIISDLELRYILISNTDRYFEIRDCVFNVRGIGVSLLDVSNGMIKNCDFNNVDNGIDILLGNSQDNVVENCVASYSDDDGGSYFFLVGYQSDNNEIFSCKATNSDETIDSSGFVLSGCDNNLIHHCEISGGTYGIALEDSNNNVFHSNEIFDNGENAKVLSGSNQWDDGISNGNYWDDYDGNEYYSISIENEDRYPMLIEGGGIRATENLESYELVAECETIVYTTSDSHDGWLEEHNGLKILHVSGSNYDMGYQHGDLLRDEIEINLGAQLSFFEDHGWPYDDILSTGYAMNDYLPQCYKDEMQGMADGSGLPLDDIIVLNTIPAVFNHAGKDSKSCCEVSIWGPNSKNGEMYHIRGWDWTFNIKDPETGEYFQSTQVLIVRNPDDAYASMDPDFAGHVFSWGGVNEKGIAIGETTCYTDDYDFEGISSAFRMRMVLDSASTSQEAINIMSNDRTDGWNFVISDGNTPEGFVIEQTKNILYVGEWDDPVEDNDPFWKVEGLIRRVPFFIHPDTAATQPGRQELYTGILGLILYALGKNGLYGGWSFYRTISQAVEKRIGTLDLEGTTKMIRNVYKGRTDLIFFIIMTIGFVRSIHQWVACPKTGDIALAVTHDGTPAFRNPVHYLNLDELLEPPSNDDYYLENDQQSTTTQQSAESTTRSTTIAGSQSSNI